MTRVLVYILEGAMLSSVALTLDVLACANRSLCASGSSPLFEVSLGGSGAGPYRRLVGAAPPRKAVADLVIFPGPGWTAEEEISARLAAPDAREAGRRLKQAAAEGCEIATSCSGAFLLAHVGLLEGRRATTSWWLAPIFRRMHPHIQLDAEALLVRDGAITTAGAALAQTDLMLDLVARYGGPELAQYCARRLLMDERRSQGRYMALNFLTGGNSFLAEVETWVRARLQQQIGVEDLAAAMGLAPRTFARRVEQITGLSPIRLVQRIRVEEAVALVETTKLSFEEIAWRVGYADPSALRRLIRRHTGSAPSQLRPAA